ncbi:LacI family DNA-binding transcriptional regulator [uncultured Vagococcus sp.]|uniref:LacI family DNA-binding transcriptional regulator n=1 Tax=uncultured Vagococcus sp. TaxID=189676 RepID=UPI0028D64D4D|nr:LacI family DNA-binding transcriptional regulator [uncultured Vagococcus sp.]
MKTTIKDIARLSGVSITTVSQVLNGKGKRFSEDTRQKVLKVVAETEYRPDYFAKNMVNPQSKTIGVIVPDITDLFFSKVIEGIETYLNEKGYVILLCDSHHSDEKEAHYVSELMDRAVEGIILATPNSIALDKLLDVKQYQSFPYVLLDRGINKRDGGNILVDEYAGAYEAVTYLIELGHRRIGMLANDSRFYKMDERTEAYRQCLADHQIAVEEPWIVSNAVTIEGGYLATKELLAKTNVSALFCGNDQMAIGAYRGIFEAGLKIPEDISVIGYDGLDITNYLTPSLTTVYQPAAGIGQAAAEILVDGILGNHRNYPNKNFPTKLLKRESVAVVLDGISF